MIALWNGRRVNGTIRSIIGNCIAEVGVGGDTHRRHFNQIWKRSMDTTSRCNTNFDFPIPSPSHLTPVIERNQGNINDHQIHTPTR